MKPLKKHDRYRVQSAWLADKHPDMAGAFMMQGPYGTLNIIAASAHGWDHVSVSAPGNRLPSWTEMKWVHEQFFEEHESSMQLHPPRADYVNDKHNVLHLWRPHDAAIPLPPKELV
jgi:hypothetical protein